MHHNDPFRTPPLPQTARGAAAQIDSVRIRPHSAYCHFRPKLLSAEPSRHSVTGSEVTIGEVPADTADTADDPPGPIWLDLV